MDLLEVKIIISGFMGSTRPVTAVQHHFAERGVLCGSHSIVAQPGPPARRAGSTEGNQVLQVLHHHCTSVLVFKGLHMLRVPSPGVDGHRAFLTHSCSTWSLMCFSPLPFCSGYLLPWAKPLLRRG